MRRWAETAAAAMLMALAAAPFVGLFPEPPAFGRCGAGIVAAAAILALTGLTFRAARPRRMRFLAWATVLLAVTTGATGAHILLASDITSKVPTLDILPKLFGLCGEEVNDAVLYEVWVELWLACALAAALVLICYRATRRRPFQTLSGASPRDVMVAQPVREPPWNAATVLLWLVGWAVLAGAVLDGHWTADFLQRANHVTGTIADQESHPRIRFTTLAGETVEFVQNGSVSRPLGAAVPVAYLTQDPSGSARADTFWVNWSDVLGLLWIGLGFTQFPFFGLRASFRAGRW